MNMLRLTLLKSRGHLYGVAMGLAVVLTAFASFFVFLEGPVSYRLRNFLASYQTLLTVLLTMTKYDALYTDGGDQFQVRSEEDFGGFCLFKLFVWWVNVWSLVSSGRML